jgi:hypothetical protein
MAFEETIGVRCCNCERPIAAGIAGKHTYENEYENEAYRYLLLICPHCGGPSLARQDGTFEESDYTNATYTRWGMPRLLYPAQLDQLDPAVPVNIARSYIGARRCFDDAGEYTAAAIMCRRTLEGICANFEAKGRDLKSKLDDLKARAIIETRMHEWADHALRALGNDAAHDVDATVSKQDALDALEFTRAIVEYLYVFAVAFQRFKERRTKPKGSGFSDALNEEPPRDEPSPS